MEEVVCDFCGSADATVLFEGTDVMFPQYQHIHAVQRCNQCGLWYLNPRPTTEEEYLAMYPPEYDSYVDLDRKWLLQLRKLNWRKELADIVSLVGSEGRFLEVGCATGEFLNELREMGCLNLIGLEYNPEVVQMARERYGLDVREGDILSGQFPNEHFDVVMMRYVLEHVPNPVETLRETHRILKPGGTYIFSIPNPVSLDAQVYGRYWFGHEVPRHLHNYPKATLKQMLESVGFEQKHIYYSFAPNDWILGFKNVLIGWGVSHKAASVWDIHNPLALALFFPLGVLSGLVKSSGRMRVVARKL
jgi:SAM-dependent methyltransferase